MTPAPRPSRPPAGLPGLDPAWSRTVPVTDAAGTTHDWHVLDSTPAAAPEQPTLLCVHGNPTWSYLWRVLLADPPPGWRVVAPDQLGMGYSARLTGARTLDERVHDLGDLTAALGLTGPVVTVAHDWGGIISLGWALEHRAQLRGIVLTNTAVHQPESGRPPVLIRLARSPLLRETTCVRTPVFLRTATRLSRPALPRGVRAAFAAPYRSASRRRAIGDFVADIPFAPDHPSAAALDRIATGIRQLTVPTLLLWGPRDPVFGEQYLRDLRDRLPQASLHRYPNASHLLPADAPEYVDAVTTWVGDLPRSDIDKPRPAQTSDAAPLDIALSDRAAHTPDEIAVAEVGGTQLSWAELDERVSRIAAGLAASGVRPGHRVALLVPPSIGLTAAVYALWRCGATIVVADKGLGLRGMGRALRSASVDHIIAGRHGRAAARAMRVPGTRLDLTALARARGGAAQSAHAFDADAEAAVVFTSGATGPAKGVVYLRRQLRAQLDLVRTTYDLSTDDRIVAAFAPFALLGPALGIATVVPDIDVTAPATLTAGKLAEAVARLDASIVFAAPAALRNVVATAELLTDAQRSALGGVRLVMSAGAPVPLPLLRAVRELLPGASVHTPYGMTEVLPVTDISLEEIEKAGAGDGVCVGRPLLGVDVRISALDAVGRAAGELTDAADVTGEICVRAAHVKQRYDALWALERSSSRNRGWHRTGDVGHLDPDGRLWVQGRLPHVIVTADGVLTPVGLELGAEQVDGVRAAAAVGVGPVGTQQLVMVIVTDDERRGVVLDLDLTDAVRAAVRAPVAAVLARPSLPVDIRHASKVDRAALADWATEVLAGRS